MMSVSAMAQEPYIAGKDYMVIDTPVRTVDPTKIEVTEVFWYGCGHCYTFLPLFHSWAEKRPEDVSIQYSPAMWNNKMKTHAQIFYTAKALDLLDVMNSEIFDAMHLQKKGLLKTAEIYPLFAKHGVSQAIFDKTFDSFGIKSQVQQADARARGYGITGTPELIINGKYRTSASLTGSHEKMLQVTEYLIEKERKAKGG
jgi:thiol:disulfide interchange protein DsbA